MPLTDIKVRNAKKLLKPYKLFDGGGLFVLVHPTGGKWWRYRYRFTGKERLLALGAYPDVSLAEARQRHTQARRVLAAGQDPSQVKKEAKRIAVLNSENTFEAIAREWCENRKHKLTERYNKYLLSCLETHIFPNLGARPIKDISAPEILSMLRVIEKRNALDLAKVVLQVIGRVFSYAIATVRADRNPAADLRGALKPHVRKHMAHLKAAEIPEYLERLEAFTGHLQTKLALKFLLLTFVRTIELRGAQWSEVDLEKAEWRIPAERMKMRGQHIVPLSQQAVAVLHELRKHTGTGQYVFPHRYKATGHVSKNIILRALHDMGYQSRATAHGFRATASTILNEHGFTPDVIERQLAHTERNSVRAAYNHAQYLPERRRMMQWWADYIDEVASTGKAPVGEFRKAG
jgi:integrase